MIKTTQRIRRNSAAYHTLKKKVSDETLLNRKRVSNFATNKAPFLSFVQYYETFKKFPECEIRLYKVS